MGRLGRNLSAVMPVIEQIARRMWRAAKLEADVYEEVEADLGATGQATLVVIVSAVLG